MKQKKVYVTIVADVLSLGIVKTPGEMGADIAVGSVQRFGVPMGYGGPHPGYIACKDEHKRRLPGRIIGVSIDVHGNKSYRMALQTREQHIRRERATSNICTAQALLANISSFYGQWHGPAGIKDMAKRVRAYADILLSELDHMKYTLVTKKDTHFDTVTVDVVASGLTSADQVLAEFHKYGINLRKVDERHVQVAFNETTNLTDLDEIIEIFADIKGAKPTDNFSQGNYYESKNYKELPNEIKRTTDFMKQGQFNDITSETQMMRYI